MNIREQVRAALAGKIEIAAPVVKPSATYKDSAAPTPQATLNIAKKFDAVIRKALGDIEKDATVTVGRLRRDQEINKPVFFMVFTIKVPRKIAASGGADEFLDELFRAKITKRNPIQVGKHICWIGNAEVNASATVFTVDCVIQYTESKPSTQKSASAEYRAQRRKDEKQVSGAASKLKKAVGAPGAPKGINKLKAFMKENSIDLKTIKSMLKHL